VIAKVLESDIDRPTATPYLVDDEVSETETAVVM
jgi:hypothetical protein